MTEYFREIRGLFYRAGLGSASATFRALLATAAKYWDFWEVRAQ